MDIQRILLQYQTSTLISTRHVACVGEEIKYSGVDCRPEGKGTFWRPKCRRKSDLPPSVRHYGV